MLGNNFVRLFSDKILFHFLFDVAYAVKAINCFHGLHSFVILTVDFGNLNNLRCAISIKSIAVLQCIMMFKTKKPLNLISQVARTNKKISILGYNAVWCDESQPMLRRNI
jgi:hypothetical protein